MKNYWMMLVLIFCVFTSALAQEKNVSGTVTDQSGLPLPGVSVLVVGTTNGTQTDFDGNYSITASTGQVLRFSYIGQKTVERTLGASSVLNITMEEDTQALEEVVVTALGIAREEKALGYSSQQVGTEKIADVPTTNIVNALSGKVSGVNITQSSGDIGSSSRITIRGISTIFGNSQPLIVVDGAVMDNNTYAGGNSGTDVPNGLADINPQDIASMNVLKGGAATALYGMRGTNGVIVVTTKTGKKNEALGISLHSSVTFSNPYIFPNYQNSYGQGHSPTYFEFVDGFGYDQGANGGDGGTDESWGPPLDQGNEFIQYSSVIANPNNPQPRPWVSHPNSVIDDFYETGMMTDNTLAFSGGTDDAAYRLSLGLVDGTGIIHNTDLKKYNISGNVNFNLSEKWSAGLSTRYIKSSSENRNAVGYGDVDNQIGQLVWGARQVKWSELRDWENLPMIETNVPNRPTPLNWNLRYNNNPFWAMDNNLHPWERNRWVGTANIGYKFTDDLSLNMSTGIDIFNDVREVQRSFGTVNFRNGYYQIEERNRYEVNSQAILSYKTNLDKQEKLNIGLSLGGNIMVNKYRFFRATAENLVIDKLFNISNSAASPILIDDSSVRKINSWFGTADISYNDYLFLNFTGRNDWASVLPIKNNSIFYPSASLSALVHSMGNFDPSGISFLKLRGSWAQTGSAGPLSPYNVSPTYGLSTYPLNGQTPTALVPNTLWNPDITAQTETAIEAGIDMRFFNNRLRLDATYYDKKNEDVIMPLSIPGSSGYSNVWKNAATVTNKGIEVILGADIISTTNNGFNLGIDINYAKNDNLVTNIEGDGVINLTNGRLWNVYTQARNDAPIGEIFGPSFERAPNGDILYSDGLPVQGDSKVLGNSQADWTGGLGINASFKGFRLRTLFDVKYGGEVYSQTNTWGMLSGVLEETLVGRESGVIGQGSMDDGNGNYIPNNIVVNAQNYYSTAFSQNIAESSVYDASFVKWRELSFSYALPRQLFKNIAVQSIDIGVTARNLAILYKKAPHIDPETAFGVDVGQQGLEYAQTPSTRTIGMNLNVKF
jgi:TonB-linked SusC/RagA family outer membrane protein